VLKGEGWGGRKAGRDIMCSLGQQRKNLEKILGKKASGSRINQPYQEKEGGTGTGLQKKKDKSEEQHGKRFGREALARRRREGGGGRPR